MIKTNSVKAWILAARPMTLTGAAIPVMLGCALAYIFACIRHGNGADVHVGGRQRLRDVGETPGFILYKN